jgi:putative ABC transport system permease protein
MFKNYFKIAVRNLLKHKVSSFINIIGFSVGMACCMLMLIYVQHEFSYDRFHKNLDQLHRVIFEFNNTELNFHHVSETTPLPLAPQLRQDFPEILNTTRIIESSEKMEYKDKQFKEYDICYGDPAIFDMFTFTFLKGDPKRALIDPSSVVISEEIARKYFVDEDPYGKIIKIGEKVFKITGIVKDLPSNSSLQLNIFLPLISSKDYSWLSTDWYNEWSTTYIQLPSNQSKEKLEEKINKYIKKYYDEKYAQGMKFYVQPMKDIHLYSKSDYGLEADGDYRVVMIYAGIALFILLIACINFINISIGQSVARFREVGVRKIMGAKRNQIIKQFWGEVFTMCIISILLALIIVEILLPGFNTFTDRNLTVVYDLSALFDIIFIVLITCILAAVLPSVVISRYNPAEVLKGTIKLGGPNKFTRALIVIQFALSIMFLNCTTIMSSQINFLLNKHKVPENEKILHVNPMNLFSIYSNDQLNNLTKLFFNEVSRNPLILSSSIEGYGMWGGSYESNGKMIMRAMCEYGEGYIETFGIKIIEGRTFNVEKYPTDSISSILVNESFVKENGLASPVGTSVSFRKKTYQIIGVIEDFSEYILKNKIHPLMIGLLKKTNGAQYFKFQEKDMAQVLTFIKNKWKEIFPDQTINYTFYDDDIKEEYTSEYKAREMFSIVTIITIILSCFGILGLTIATITKRVKEIGIRKVFGASTNKIVILLVKEFVILIVIAAIIAGPAAYYYMNKWLQDFVYRIDISIQVFVFSCAITILVALFTISFLTIRAARANPVEALRYE